MDEISLYSESIVNVKEEEIREITEICLKSVKKVEKENGKKETLEKGHLFLLHPVKEENNREIESGQEELRAVEEVFLKCMKEEEQKEGEMKEPIQEQDPLFLGNVEEEEGETGLTNEELIDEDTDRKSPALPGTLKTESLEQLAQSAAVNRTVRPRHPPLEYRDGMRIRHWPITSSEAEENSAIIQKKSAVNMKNKRKAATDNKMATILANNEKQNITVAASVSAAEKPDALISEVAESGKMPAEASVLGTSEVDKDALICQLTKRVKLLEKELNDKKIASAAKCHNCQKGQCSNSDLLKRLDKMESRMKTMEDILKMGPPRSPASCRMSDSSTQSSILRDTFLDRVPETRDIPSEEYVSLGEGWRVTKVAFSVMESTKEIHVWGVAVLRGVFGDQASQYRCRPRKEGLRRFPSSFLNAAKYHYNKFLRRLGYKEAALQRYLNTMGSMLADRATDMEGHRGRPKSVRRSSDNKILENNWEGPVLDPAMGELMLKRETVLDPVTGMFVQI